MGLPVVFTFGNSLESVSRSGSFAVELRQEHFGHLHEHLLRREL